MSAAVCKRRVSCAHDPRERACGEVPISLLGERLTALEQPDRHIRVERAGLHGIRERRLEGRRHPPDCTRPRRMWPWRGFWRVSGRGRAPAGRRGSAWPGGSERASVRGGRGRLTPWARSGSPSRMASCSASGHQSWSSVMPEAACTIIRSRGTSRGRRASRMASISSRKRSLVERTPSARISTSGVSRTTRS